MSTMPKVAVVILNWNGAKHLAQFLPSVLTSVWPNLEIVVGDNASTDNSVEMLKRDFPSVTIIQNTDNFGFTGGYNKVLAQVEADYFILLNSDVEVQPGWITPVIELMESDDKIAVAAPKIKSFSERDHFEHAGAAGGFIDNLGYPFCRGRIFYEVEEDKGQYDESGEVFWASGASMFIKKKYWDEAGGFDQRFFAHMEEIDLCWRLKNRGYKIMYCAQSEVFHLGGGTLNTENPFKTYLNFRNNLLLLKKNLPYWRSVSVISARLWLDAIAMVRFLSEGKRKDAWAVGRAPQKFFRNIYKRGNPRESQKSKVKSQKSPRITYSTKLKGMYMGSIIVDFFIKKKHLFTQLNQDDFC